MLYLFGLAMMALGIVLTVNPKQCTKEEFRDKPEIVKKTRRTGIIYICCGVVVVVLSYVLSSLG
ncbi:MAG: hypothetical protein J6V94_00685 [Lachnospiraceae bacterium]|nr:hypothetical protein [Lachnospiraceae bacterium]